jgi:hypothetical protein
VASRQDPTKRLAKRSQMDQRFNTASVLGEGIKPGAHPEFDQPTPLDKLVGAAKGIADRFKRRKK